ncbi:ABC transporter substrate-binding protein [Rhodococcus sp. HNM0569]|uniref:ABC transporter substrate-binding protein n=1 Tax=Rhodococcus sp. HNM0569 TaxID=2716340 RepID=UPI00146B307E|nr:ABC transporter substrate-binding protein [Rhodococcus sp. HNM0569]NLU82038.1 ABC transporter substrate-binding protein [Rhodococcus sp. HNM0569]
MTYCPRSRVRIPAAVVAAGALLLAGCSTDGTGDDASTIVRTTTAIAGAAVVGIERDTTAACADPTPADRPGAGTHTVSHAGGESVVPDDPQRIVVLDPAAMDAVCALGLWERVVGTTAGDLPGGHPQYLGTGVREIPVTGPIGAPDVEAIRAADPDLVLGSDPATASAAELGAVAPTVFTGSDQVYWKNSFTVAGAALGRSKAAADALASYEKDAADLGTELGAGQTQASLVQFDADSLSIEGPASFAGQVLSDVGVRRPADQRLTDAVDADISNDIARAEGDLVYVVLSDDASKEHGEQVMDGDEWQDLEAAVDNRVFVVDATVWGGNGLTAARAVLTDVRNSLNGYAS